VRFLSLFALSGLFFLAACDDDLGPGFWDPTPDTLTIYSISRPDLIGLPSAFDGVQLRRVAVESPSATGTWDFVLAEQGANFVMVPASALGGAPSRAGIATIGTGALEDILEAPSDTAAFSALPVVIQPGTNYVLRTRREVCSGFGTGVFYAKLQAVGVDASNGTYRFAVVRNPYCNDRRLVPPEQND
jgi:hypothetical protein